MVLFLQCLGHVDTGATSGREHAHLAYDVGNVIWHSSAAALSGVAVRAAGNQLHCP
jgi:hypothetical protein